MASLHPVDRAHVVEVARSLLRPRVLFRPYGRDPESGLDCIGVIDWVGKQCGYLPKDLVIPCYAYPPQREAFELFNDYMVERTDVVERGAVVILTKDGKTPQHTGIVDWADDKWKCIGIDVEAHRPWVTITPLSVDMVWRVYDFISP